MFQRSSDYPILKYFFCNISFDTYFLISLKYVKI